jgi:hypothetical protein
VEDEKVISCLTLVQPFDKKGQRGSVVMFMDDSIYNVREYVYLIKMKKFYDWKLGVVGRGVSAVYHFTLTYWLDKGIVLREDLRQDRTSANIIEYLNIELDEILHDDIRHYDDVTKTLYSNNLIEEFKKQFDVRNESMKILDSFNE